MNRLLKTILLAVVIFVGGWFLYHRERIKTTDDVVSLVRENFAYLTSFDLSHSDPPAPQRLTAIPTTPNTIRIATYKLNASTIANLSQQQYGLIADTCRQFDLVAVQELSPLDPELPGKLMAAINAGGLKYRLVIEPPLPGSGQQKLFGFVYNSQTIELENSHTYQVNDPDELMTRDPMVGWFRARTLQQDQAFTFSVANLQLDPNRPDQELEFLPQLFRAIRLDGRGEDDILLVGDFDAGDQRLIRLNRTAALSWVLTNTATNTEGTSQLDNIVIDPGATVEFTNRSGVLDVLKWYNLRLDEARQLSDHMPVWAEFSTQEGKTSGRVAQLPPGE